MLKFQNTPKSLILPTLLASFVLVTSSIAMDLLENPRQTIRKKQQRSEFNPRESIDISTTQFSAICKQEANHIFHKLNASLSFLLTTKEALLTALDDPQNFNYTFILTAPAPSKNLFVNGLFAQELRNMEVSETSLNALKLVYAFMSKFPTLHNITGINATTLQTFHNNPLNFLDFIKARAPQEFMEFLAENSSTVNTFIGLMLNAHKDPGISQLILNLEKFDILYKNQHLMELIGKPDIFPLQMASNRFASTVQGFFVMAELQLHIDSLLLFKKEIFPTGDIASYRHNDSTLAGQYFESQLETLQTFANNMNQNFSWADEVVELTPGLEFLKMWKNFSFVLHENQKDMLKLIPKKYAVCKGLKSPAVTKIYNSKYDKVLGYTQAFYAFKNQLDKLTKQSALHALKSDASQSRSKKSYQISCKSISLNLGENELSLEITFETLEQQLSRLVDHRKEMELSPQSFFIGNVIQELAALNPHLKPITRIPSQVSTLVPVQPCKMQESIPSPVSLIPAVEMPPAAAAAEKAVPQIPLEQFTEVLTSLVQKGVVEVSREPTVEPLKVEAQNSIPLNVSTQEQYEEEVEFGRNYFKQLNDYYRNLKINNTANETSPALTPYEQQFYPFLLKNVFNNVHLPSWSSLTDSLRSFGFIGKPNTVGDGSTWVFSVTQKCTLFFNDVYYKEATFNVHCPHGKKGNEPIPYAFLKFFQSGFSHIFGLSKEFIEIRLKQNEPKS